MFKVYETPCKNCLLTRNRLVSEERAEELIEACKEKETHFTCHKSSMEDDDTCCYFFYKLYWQQITKLQIFTRLGMITYVPMPDHDLLTPYKDQK